MTNNTIITIGRQFGSGGREVGKILSERLNIPLYDHKLIHMAAQEVHISDEEAARVDETILGRFLSAYVVSTGDYTAFIRDDVYQIPMSDRIYETQKQIILKLASQQSCIFVGRCADYILGDYTNCINVFIHAYKEDRIRRIMNIYNLNEKQAWDKIKKVERERKLYYEARTGREWGSIETHEILLNASLLGINGTAEVLEAVYKK